MPRDRAAFPPGTSASPRSWAWTSWLSACTRVRSLLPMLRLAFPGQFRCATAKFLAQHCSLYVHHLDDLCGTRGDIAQFDSPPRFEIGRRNVELAKISFLNLGRSHVHAHPRTPSAASASPSRSSSPGSRLPREHALANFHSVDSRGAEPPLTTALMESPASSSRRALGVVSSNVAGQGHLPAAVVLPRHGLRTRQEKVVPAGLVVPAEERVKTPADVRSAGPNPAGQFRAQPRLGLDPESVAPSPRRP